MDMYWFPCLDNWVLDCKVSPIGIFGWLMFIRLPIWITSDRNILDFLFRYRVMKMYWFLYLDVK